MKGIFLLHGFLTNPEDYTPIMEQLRQIYDRVYCPLYPGHYLETDKVKFKAEDLLKMVNEEFTRFRQECDVVDVIGFSMGGAIASYLAANYEFRNLVLLAPANKFYNFAFLPMTLVYYVKKFSLKRKYKKKYSSQIGGNLVDAVDKNIRQVNRSKKIAFKIGFTRVVPNWTFSNLKNFRKIIKTCNNGIQKIDKPTLILWGHLDQLVNKNSPKFIYDKVTSQNKEMYFFDDMSHLMLRSVNIDRITNSVISFLQRNDK